MLENEMLFFERSRFKQCSMHYDKELYKQFALNHCL